MTDQAYQETPEHRKGYEAFREELRAWAPITMNWEASS